MPSRLARNACPIALAIAVLVSAYAPAAAQDGPAPEPAARAAPDAERAAAALSRLERAYAAASTRPAPVDTSLAGDAKAIAKERARYAREERSWLAALERLPALADDYRTAAGDAAEPKAWYVAGFALVARASRSGGDAGRDLLRRGADELRTYLGRAPQDASFRPDAERHLTTALLRLADGDADAVMAAVPHADRGVRALLALGRADDAGALAYAILRSLDFVGHQEDAARLGTAWDAERADFGRSAKSVRFLLRRARVRTGETLPELPELASCTGAPMPWEELRGHPFVLHFFNTTVSSTAREVETILVPLRDRWHEKGLRIVGCSTDREMSDAEIERTRALWEEWGKQEILRDGRKVSVRAWAEERGLDWPFYWDGKWMNNTLAQALGVEVNAPLAILVDAAGVIRFRGKPFEGLPEAVETLMQ